MSETITPSVTSALLSSYLRQLRLPTMAASCAAVAREAAASNLDYLAFLTVLCGQEVAQREQSQAVRRVAQAQFPWPKTLDEFDFSVATSVKQAAILQLASGAFVRGHENWLLLGGPGVGKTHLLCGVGRALCQQQLIHQRFRSAAALVNELLLADQEHRLPRLLKQWRSIDLTRLTRLVIAACLAYIWLVYLGVCALNKAWRKRLHRSDRCDLSLFQLGMRLLDVCLNEGSMIPKGLLVPATEPNATKQHMPGCVA